MTVYQFKLSTTAVANQVELIRVRQDDDESQIFRATIFEDGKVKNLNGVSAEFNMVDAQHHIVVDDARIVDATNGIVEYQLRKEAMLSVGRCNAYFSFKSNKEVVYSTKDFNYNVIWSALSSPMHQGCDYVWTASDLIDSLKDWIEHAMGDFDDWFESVKEILASIDPGGVILNELLDARVDMLGERHKSLSERLVADFSNVIGKVNRIVHVDDFGAIPDGKTDSTEAFKNALADGNVKVEMSAGTYIVKEILMPNNSHLNGQGSALSRIKLHNDAPASAIVITNKVMDGQAKNIAVTGVSLDWNKSRQGGILKPTGGSRSSTLRFAGVKHGYAADVYTTGSALHGIDITYASDSYFYEGDGNRVPEELESKYVTILDCDATDFGDDGITTHHSRYLTIINSGGHHSRGTGNSNGIEIDDGSQYVYLKNTYSEECYSGLEIKGHATTSSAGGIFVDGHTSTRDCRSFNFRHIGHHAASDPNSKTAYGIVASGLVAITPYANEIYKGTTPRALVISAFVNVQIIGFTAIGDKTFTAGQPVVAIQFKTQNVTIANTNIRGFTNASYDIQVYGGDNRGEGVTLSNVNLFKSAVNGIYNGGGVYDTKIIGGTLVGNGMGYAIESINNTAQIIGITQKNYKKAAKITAVEYDVLPTVLKGGASIATTGGGATDPSSAIIASTGDSKAVSPRSVVMASADNSVARGSRTAVLTSSASETESGGYAQTIISSKGVQAPGNYQTVFGYGDGEPSKANVKVNINSFNGTIKATGAITGSSSLTDFAEYFETENGEKLEDGTVVTLQKGFVKIAEENDDIIGAISGTAGIILGENTYHHKNKYLKTKFGAVITEKIEKINDADGEKIVTIIEQPIINPEYNEALELMYQAREHRQEWNVVGLKGQLLIKVAQSVCVDDYIKTAVNGIGVKGESGWKVMNIEHPFDKSDGYAVAKVLI